jgi:translocation and assembly module TamB
MDEPGPIPPTSSAATPTVRRRIWLWLLLGLVALLLTLLLAGAGSLRWVLATESGAAWLLARLPGVQASGIRGSVLGGELRLQQLRITWKNGQASLTLDDVQASGLRWRWRPTDAAPGTWVALDMDRLVAGQAHYVHGPSSPDPLTLPASLALPLQLSLREAEVATLRIDTLAPATGLRVRGLVLDSRAGAAHSIEALEGRWQGLAMQALARVANAPPFATEARVPLRPAADGDRPAWGAALSASGPLERLAVQATLRGVQREGQPAAALDLRSEVRPFQAWPLGELDLKTSQLNLASLHPSAPATRLTGSAVVQSRAIDAPIAAKVKLDNALPGRWNEGHLPVSRVELDLSGRIDQPDRLDLSRFSVDLADATRSAGRWTGQGHWAGHRLVLDTRLEGVNPQRLDGRAAAMRLSGPLALDLLGLPSLDPAATGSPPPWLARLQLNLEGLPDATPQPVKLKLEAEADANRIELKQVLARTGTARADAQARLQRSGPAASWQLVTRGELAHFDPAPWVPGDASAQGTAWRRGPHQLSGQWQLDVRLPADAARLPPLALAQRLAGNGSLQLKDSLLAGLPLQADATLAYTPGPSTAADSGSGSGSGSLQLRLNLAGNSLSAEGRGNPAGNGESDQWRGELQADQLAALAPLARVLPDLADWAPSQGSARLQLSATGRWPDLHTEGHADVQQLKAGTLALTRGSFGWQLDTGRNQPLAMTLDVAGLRLGKQRADQLRGTVRGVLAAHRIDLEAVLPLLPPPAAATVLGLAMPVPAPASQAASGTRALLAAQGAWLPQPEGGGGRWRAVVNRLAVGGWDGRPLAHWVASASPAASAAAPAAAAAWLSGPTWADASDLRAELQFDAAGTLVALRADAGRMRLADTASLRWDAVSIDLQASPARIELNAEVEPFAVAPLLARLQPEMGWQGDLSLGARVVVQAGDRYTADIQVERRSGDLAAGSTSPPPAPGSPTGSPPQAMGLSELKLALSARDGVWAFQGDMAGATLGELRGRLQARTTPEARWPGTDAPLQGELQLRVADIGIWNAWVPAGWRISGTLQGMARIDGRFGAPRYTGELNGSKLALRNLLQGVNVNDGDVVVRLAGDNAVIERFALRGGEGTLSITGNASLGESPRARLQLQAERFRVLGRVDRQLITSGQATLDLNKDALRVDGRIGVDEGRFDISSANAPTLDDDVNVRRPGMPVVDTTEATAQRPRRNVAVNIDLDLGQQLRLRGYGLDTGLRGQVKISSPAARLAINGTVTAEDGTFTGYGQKMQIERGVVAFSGPPGDPRLDVLAIRPNLDMRVGVTLSGNLSTLRVRLFSDPEMSENAKLSWLLLGREPDGLGRTDTALLQRAAVALLAGGGEAPTDALLRNLGIDELSLRQSDGDVRETVITLGKQLSRRWYVGYERGVNSTTGTWQLIYRIAQRFTLRAQSGLENSIDLIWVWRVDETPEPPAGSVRKSVVTPP